MVTALIFALQREITVEFHFSEAWDIALLREVFMHHNIKSDTLYNMESMLQYTVLLALGLYPTPPSDPRVGTSDSPKLVTYPEGLVDTQHPAVPDAHPVVVSAQSQLNTWELGSYFCFCKNK